MAKGYITIRNEDGTQWAKNFGGFQCWAESKRDANLFSREVFEIMKKGVDESKKNDCPDNGFFGWYNLAFHEVPGK